jgi:hypothetical protein
MLSEHLRYFADKRAGWTAYHDGNGGCPDLTKLKILSPVVGVLPSCATNRNIPRVHHGTALTTAMIAGAVLLGCGPLFVKLGF